MKPIWKYILITIFATLILGYFVFSLLYFSVSKKETVCKQLNIELIDSTKIQLITEKNIAEILNENDLNPIGKSIKNIHTEAVESLLRKNSMIKMAECYKTPSGIVNIRIQQRLPKFRVVGLGSYYIDADRKPMPVSPNYAAYVPVVSGKVTVSMAADKIFDFVTFLEENPFWNAQIEQIVVRDDKKIELIPRVGEAVILLGTLDNFQSKLEKLHKLYAYGFNTIGWNRYKVIDLQYKDQVVCNKDILTKPQPIVIPVEKKDSIIASKL